MRLIDADELLEHVWDADTRVGYVQVVDRQDIENAPTIEERKKGKWIPFDYPWYRCSECGAVRENKSFLENYCPNCGADMRGEGNETD